MAVIRWKCGMGNVPENKKKRRGDTMRALAYFSQIGITLFACVLIGVFLGRFLDRILGTSPWLLLVFSLLGVVAAFREIFRLLKKK